MNYSDHPSNTCRINKFITRFGSMFDPLIVTFDGNTYIPSKNTEDGTYNYHLIERKENDY